MTITRRTALVAGAWVTTAALGVAALTGVAMAANPGASASGTAASASSPGGAAAAAGARSTHGSLLRAFGKRVLHGEFSVQTKEGVTLYDTEIGVITSVSPTSVEVKATDGFTQTWTLNSMTRVRADRHKATVADLKVGQNVRLLGPTSGGSATARIAVVRPTT